MKGHKLGIFISDDIKTDLITLGASAPAPESPSEDAIESTVSVAAPATSPESSTLAAATVSVKSADSDEATEVPTKLNVSHVGNTTE